MWFEILPSGLIVVALIAVPQYTSYFWNKAVFGNSYRRDLSTSWARNMFTRDCRVSGAPWIIKGLESIPDEE